MGKAESAKLALRLMKIATLAKDLKASHSVQVKTGYSEYSPSRTEYLDSGKALGYVEGLCIAAAAAIVKAEFEDAASVVSEIRSQP